MSKGLEQRKNIKKKPSLSLKEKRQRKHDKKNAKEQNLQEPFVM